jgi:hypothetical protein
METTRRGGLDCYLLSSFNRREIVDQWKGFHNIGGRGTEINIIVLLKFICLDTLDVAISSKVICKMSHKRRSG